MNRELTAAEQQDYVARIAPLLADKDHHSARTIHAVIVDATGSVLEADIVWKIASNRAAGRPEIVWFRSLGCFIPDRPAYRPRRRLT